MVRRLVALVLAHVLAAIVGTIVLAGRRYVVYDVPIVDSLSPVRFLPNLVIGPVFAGTALLGFLANPSTLPGKRLCESLGYFVPLVGGYVVIARALLRARVVTPGICAKCGYDLRASTGRCPECGEVIAVLGGGSGGRGV